MDKIIQPTRNIMKHRNPVISGRTFELVTNIEPVLYARGYTKYIFEPKSKYGYMLSSKHEPNIRYFTQAGLKMYSKTMMNVKLNRHPDECYIVNPTTLQTNNLTLKIIEKKAQYSMGSIDTKLYAAPLFKDEYMEAFTKSGLNINVEYAFCLNSFFKSTKYSHIFKRLEKYDIPVFFGEDNTYFKDVMDWVKG